MNTGKILGGLVLLALLAAIGWGGHRLWGSDAPSEPPPVSGVPPRPLPTASGAGSGGSRPPSQPEARAEAESDPVQRLCQAMRADLGNARDQATLEQNLVRAKRQAREQLATLIERARASSNLTERAAAHLLQAQLTAQNAIQAMEQETPGCSHIVACVARERNAEAAAWAKESSELAKLALASSDPALYAMAYHSCNHLDNQNHGFCQQISARQWAQRDPANGNAWLYMANQSLSRGLEPGNSEIDSAMLHMLQAQTFDQRTGTLTQLADSPLFQTQSAFARLELLRLVGHINELTNLPPLHSVTQYCHPKQLNDSNRRQVCDAVANKLASDENNVLSARQAYEIGEKLGWPAARLQPLQQQYDAFMGLALRLDQPAPETPATGLAPADKFAAECRAELAALAHMARTLQEGEVKVLRQRLAQNKLSQAEMAARFRAHEKKFEPAAASAESSK